MNKIAEVRGSEPVEKFFNIPNILSLYRLVSFPAILVLALKGYEQLFVIFFLINLATDVLDGLIARIFNLQTAIGARLDSLADVGSYILAFTGVLLFKSGDFAPHMVSFYIFLGFYLSRYIFALLKFGKMASFHLYSGKIGGYMQGGFFFVLFAFGFNPWYYYIMICWGIFSFTENLVIQVILPELESDVQGLYWVLTRKRKRAETHSEMA
ncbi:MAG: CDP-alcohol phosphatidyltransferase family protein [bacterium]|nr:CDP-alcohol phosphatidyltransferase family protein [bacterium]